MPQYNASEVKTPSGLVPTAGAVASQIAAAAGSAGGGSVALRNFIKPMKGVWPAADPTNGPLTSYGIVSGVPNSTGRIFYPWNSGVFNTQSQNWLVCGTGTGQNSSGYSACYNNSTSRFWNYGYLTGFGVESNIDFGFHTDANDISIVYFLNTSYSQPSYHDVQVYVEYEGGEMRKLTRMPISSAGGGGIYTVSITFKEQRPKNFRVMLPSNANFIGVSVNQAADITKSPNVPLFAYNGDSWGEPNGNILSTGGTGYGGAYPGGTYRNVGVPQMIAEETGWQLILMAQGGTGEYNVVDGQSHSADYVDAGGNTTFHGTTRINDFWTKFGTRSPIILTLGGWNDGALPANAAAYQATVDAGIKRWAAKKADIKLIYSGIQPVGTTAGDIRRLCSAGQAAAVAANPNNAIGFVDQMQMWTSQGNSAGEQRNARVNTTDGIHLQSFGATSVAGWNVARFGNFLIPTKYINDQLTWNG